jgi:hypothetical protein
LEETSRYGQVLYKQLNGIGLTTGVVYLALYNEISTNGQTEIGDGSFVLRFDRQHIYLGLGCVFNDKIRFIAGAMGQTRANWSKWQSLFSLSGSFYGWFMLTNISLKGVSSSSVGASFVRMRRISIRWANYSILSA